MKRLLLASLLAMGLAVSVIAQVAVPNTLVSGTVISSSALNTNFTTIANHALDRLSGGHLSGNVTVDGGVTIAGVDLAVQACTTCGPTFDHLTLTTGPLTVAGNAIVNTSGKIPALSTTYFTSVDGSAFTNLTATNIVGLVPAASLPCVPTVTAKSALYTAAACDYVEANGTFTVTLPAAASNTNKIIDVKNVGSGVITVKGNGAETIDGANTQLLSAQWNSYTLISNGTSWDIR